MGFWCVWSAGAEAGLLTAYRRAAGLALQVWRRWLGGRAVGGGAASKLYRVSRGDEVHVASPQYFVNSSFATVLLSRRRIQSVADVLQGIQHNGSTNRSTLLRSALVCARFSLAGSPCGSNMGKKKTINPFGGHTVFREKKEHFFIGRGQKTHTSLLEIGDFFAEVKPLQQQFFFQKTFSFRIVKFS